MKLQTKFSAVAIATLFTVGFASASTMQIGSYGTSNSNMGNQNTAAVYQGYNSTTSDNTMVSPVVLPSSSVTTDISNTNVSNFAIWTAPEPNSSYVSYGTSEATSTGPSGPQTQSSFAPNGTYVFTSTFMDNYPSWSSGDLWVMADDTTSVFLNGNLVLTAYTGNSYPHCALDTPNCVTPVEAFLPTMDFVSGLNTLTFDVQQDASYYMGVDYAGTIVTPEPGTLFLFGSGMIGLAFALFSGKRRSQHTNA